MFTILAIALAAAPSVAMSSELPTPISSPEQIAISSKPTILHRDRDLLVSDATEEWCRAKVKMFVASSIPASAITVNGKAGLQMPMNACRRTMNSIKVKDYFLPEGIPDTSALRERSNAFLPD